MSDQEIGRLLLLLVAILACAHFFGHVFARLRQPRVIGEILAGVVLGPSLLGRVAPEFSRSLFSGSGHKSEIVLAFLYTLGLLLLMFVSGTETRRLFARKDRRQTAWLAVVGTGLPFLFVLAFSPWLPFETLVGEAKARVPLLLIVGIAVAVTSIPVISRIFHDLGILHTRFASLVLGVAVVEDIALWGVLGVATALATSLALPQTKIAMHVGATLAYFCIGLTLAPMLLRRMHKARWNVLAAASPAGYLIGLLFAYTALATAFDVSPIFAAFLAGFALTSDADRFRDALDSISSFSFAVFIPIYFAVVGYRLDLSRS
ncbi:MAG TPA: cation:proton antiporter, partial [Terriglobales bacterium]|nr:cation:proton antiporter [Terriglobales bacterium]